MRRVAWSALLLWLAALGSAAATPEPTVLRFDVSARVDVGPDGTAHVVQMGKVGKLSDVPSLLPVADTIAQRLRERIESWQFIPAMQNGVAVNSRTHLDVSMNARDDGRGGMAVTVVSASTGGSLQHWDARSLVGALMKAPEDVFLVADMHYGADGRVTDVVFTDGRPSHPARFLSRADRVFQKRIAHVMEQWTFEPEIVDGRPIAGRGTMPMRVCLSSTSCSVEKDASDATPGTDMQFASADPAVKLRSAVAGTAL